MTRTSTDPVFAPLASREEGRAVAADGTVLHFQVFDDGATPPGRAVLLANGIGVTHTGFLEQIRHLRSSHRVVTWDYRGVGRSAVPSRDASLSIETHAEDLLTVAEAAGVREAVIIGWSMGVQVGLEAICRQPQLVKGFVALFGTYGRPFATAFPAPVSKATELVFSAMRRQPLTMSALLALAVRLPGVTVPLLETVRFVGRGARRAVFLRDVNDVAENDHRAYLDSMLSLCHHDAWDLLPDVGCPVLVVAGTRDHLTPPRVARAMAERVQDGECVILEGASHFGLIEPGYDINSHIDGLLARVWTPSGDLSRPQRPTIGDIT